MPKEFDNCVKAGGEVRTLTGPREEKPKLKADEYIHVCIASDGGRYWSYKRKKKIKKEIEEVQEELKEKIKYDEEFIQEVINALVSSDIPELSKPGGIPIFQEDAKKTRKRRVKKVKIEISLEDVTSKMLQELSDVDVYEKHCEVHRWWNETDHDREELENVHKLIVQEFENKEMIHHSWDSLDA